METPKRAKTLAKDLEFFDPLREPVHGKNILITGRRGTGKTHLVSWLVRQMDKRGPFKSSYVTTPVLKIEGTVARVFPRGKCSETFDFGYFFIEKPEITVADEFSNNREIFGRRGLEKIFDYATGFPEMTTVVATQSPKIMRMSSIGSADYVFIMYSSKLEYLKKSPLIRSFLPAFDNDIDVFEATWNKYIGGTYFTALVLAKDGRVFWTIAAPED